MREWYIRNHEVKRKFGVNRRWLTKGNKVFFVFSFFIDKDNKWNNMHKRDTMYFK